VCNFCVFHERFREEIAKNVTIAGNPLACLLLATRGWSGETKEFKKNKEIAQYLQTKLGALVGPGPLQEIVTMAYNEVGTTAPYMTASHWDRFLTELVDRLREIKGDTVAAKAEKEWRAYLKQVLGSFV